MQPKMVENWWAQAKIGEEEIAASRAKLVPFEGALTLGDWTVEDREQLREGRDQVLNQTFQQNFKQCEPTWGRGCQFLNCCWLEHMGDNPLGQGYEVREPHHVTEVELISQREKPDGEEKAEG